MIYAEIGDKRQSQTLQEEARKIKNKLKGGDIGGEDGEQAYQELVVWMLW